MDATKSKLFRFNSGNQGSQADGIVVVHAVGAGELANLFAVHVVDVRSGGDLRHNKFLMVTLGV